MIIHKLVFVPLSKKDGDIQVLSIYGHQMMATETSKTTIFEPVFIMHLYIIGQQTYPSYIFFY